IKKLLDNNASVNNKLSKNNIDITPLVHAINIFDKHISIMENPNDLIKEINKKIEKIIKKKKDYKNNIIKYGNNIMGQILLMLNHNFYLLSKQYSNNWTYDKQKLLLSEYKKYGITDPDD